MKKPRKQKTQELEARLAASEARLHAALMDGQDAGIRLAIATIDKATLPHALGPGAQRARRFLVAQLEALNHD
jgi:hypothetical protein